MDNSIQGSCKFTYFAYFVASICMLSAITSSQVPPKIAPVLTERKLMKGGRYQVTCATSEGDMPFTFNWMKNGQPLTENSHLSLKRLDDLSSILFISAATEADSGNYTCIVSNIIGSDSLTTTLHVLVPPTWVRQPQDVSLAAGNKVFLPCEASSNPLPTTKWRRTKGFNVQQSHPVSEAHWRFMTDGSLTTNELKKDDEGFYTCEVSNGVGDTLSKTIRLEVQVPPMALLPAMVETTKKGEESVLRCNATGDRPLKVVWLKAGEEIKADSSERITLTSIELGDIITLEVTITKTDQAHSGLYTCKVSNSHGQNQQSVRLNVVEAPSSPGEVKCTHIWSRSIRLSWSQSDSGRSPIKSYKIRYWAAGLEEMANHVEVDSAQTSFILEHLDPYTEYLLSVAADNKIGVSEYSTPVVALTREEEPESPPTDIQIEEKGITEVRLSWKPPLRKTWNGKLLGFYVGYKKASYGTPQPYSFSHVHYVEGKSSQEHTIHGLQKSTSYNIIVRAYNKAGIGPSSQQILVTTSYGETPPSPAVVLLATRYSLIELAISTKRKIPVIDYLIHLKRSGEKWHRIPVKKSNVETYAIGGLTGGQQYQMYITARNEYGESGPTEVMTFSTSEKRSDAYPELEDETFYLKLSFIIPVVVSTTIVVVLPLVTCCFLHKLSSALLDSEGIEARGFTYTAAVPPQRTDLITSGAARSLPRAPPPPPQPPPSSYSALQTYGNDAEYDDPRYDSVVEEMKNFIGAHQRANKTTL